MKRSRRLASAIEHAWRRNRGTEPKSGRRAVAVRALSYGIIDLDLGNEHASRIALALFRKGTPLVFLSRETVHPLPDRLEAAPRFFKPPDCRSLMRVLAQIADSSGYRDEHLLA